MYWSDVCTGQIYWSCYIRELMNWIVQLSYGNMTVVGTNIKYSALYVTKIFVLYYMKFHMVKIFAVRKLKLQL